MNFRHIYAHAPTGPTRQQRMNSFSNYCDLFNYILSSDDPVPLELPDIWLWELIDEFIYQYQNFTQYRARLNKLDNEDLEILSANNKIWNVLCVLNVLHSLVEKSNIKLQLQVSANGGDPESVAGKFGHHSLYKMLGFFSLIGLLRLHSLLGDYYEAINVRKLSFFLEIFLTRSHKSLGVEKYRIAQKIAIFKRTGLSNNDIVLRRFRLHDDAALLGCDSHFLFDFVVHPTN